MNVFELNPSKIVEVKDGDWIYFTQKPQKAHFVFRKTPLGMFEILKNRFWFVPGYQVVTPNRLEVLKLQSLLPMYTERKGVTILIQEEITES